MSVLSLLTNTASLAVLSTTEQSSITTSISTLQTRLSQHFSSGLIKQHFCFGSSTQGTILPRSMDERSDIDYMIVFSENNATPQTYLNRLKAFVEKYYKSSDIRQSSPTIILELNHIKFDLIPATTTWLGELQIPDGSGSWMTTNPNDFNTTLEAKNKENKSLNKPSIRLFKYWNAISGFSFRSSFEMEKWICGLSFWLRANQKDYFFAVIDNLKTCNPTQKNANRLYHVPTMHTEIELTLCLPAEQQTNFARQVAQLFPQASPPCTHTLTDRYYDTPTLDLARQGMGLRMRQQNGQWRQTVKWKQADAGPPPGGDAPHHTGLHTRAEIEQATTSAELELHRIDHAPTRDFLSSAQIAPRLQPVFSTRITRTLWHIPCAHHALVELALDIGIIQCNEQAVPVSEIELELKQGSAEALFVLAQTLQQAFTLPPQTHNKAERGYRLLLQTASNAPDTGHARATPQTEG